MISQLRQRKKIGKERYMNKNMLIKSSISNVIKILILLLSFILTGCITIDESIITDPNILAIETNYDLESECVSHNFFTSKNSGKYWKNPNSLIATDLTSKSKKSFETLNDLLLYLKENFDLSYVPHYKRSRQFLLRKENTVVHFYRESGLYYLKLFKINIDNDSLDKYVKLTQEHQNKKEKTQSINEEIKLRKDPLLKKTRQVAYTAYRTVTKQRLVIIGYEEYYTWQGPSLHIDEDGSAVTRGGREKVGEKPIYQIETYTEEEPYTAYREEIYYENKSLYNPARLKELNDENTKLNGEINTLEVRIKSSECDFYEIEYFEFEKGV